MWEHWEGDSPALRCASRAEVQAASPASCTPSLVPVLPPASASCNRAALREKPQEQNVEMHESAPAGNNVHTPSETYMNKQITHRIYYTNGNTIHPIHHISTMSRTERPTEPHQPPDWPQDDTERMDSIRRELQLVERNVPALCAVQHTRGMVHGGIYGAVAGWAVNTALKFVCK